MESEGEITSDESDGEIKDENDHSDASKAIFKISSQSNN
jgi:hypothetical protein